MSEKRKFLVNSLSVVIQQFSQGVATFLLTAILARTLGAEALGQYLLGISFFYFFVTLGSQGFKTLFTREIARNYQSTPLYLVNGIVLQLFFCIISYLALLVVVFLLPYSAETSMVCYIIGLAIIPFGLSNITESILQAQEKMHLVAISTVPIYFLRLIAILIAIKLNYGINYVGIIFVISELLIFLIELPIVTKEVKPDWQIDQDFIWKSINKARTFLAIEGIGILAAKIDIFLISLVGSELLIGIYGAMKQMLQPFYIVSRGVSLAAFPKLAKAATVGKSQQKKITEDIIAVLLFMSLPFFISLGFLGQDLLLIVYKDESFQGVGLIFNLLAISVITSSFSRIFNYLLTANGHEKIQLIEVIITTTVAALAGILLIAEYKLMGAAYMSVARTFANFATLTFAVYTRIFAIDLWKIIKLPLLITGLMAAILYVAKILNFSLATIIIIDIVIYTVCVSAIAIYLSGGVGTLKNKILNRSRG